MHLLRSARRRRISELRAVLLVLGLAIGTGAHAGAEPLAAPWVERAWDDFPVEILVGDLTELDALSTALGTAPLQRDSVMPHRAGVLVRLRVDMMQLHALEAAGFVVHRVEDLERSGREQAEREGAERARLDRRVAFSFPLAVYPSSVEIAQILTDLAAAHPDLAAVYAWGTSVEGRPLLGLVISDQVGTEEAEPEVRLAAGIHGDEPVDTILLLNLAHELLVHHGQPGHERITELVDGYEIHILPQLNPDGYTAGIRTNANAVDLNRNFPEPTFQHAERQLETLHFMGHALDHHFVISQNGHGGALVVNYPWDYTFTRAPDDAALIELSLEYSTQNLPMYNGAFAQGITNGADWYVVKGSLQDWSYAVTGCSDLTIEVSNVKWPAASTLAGFWNDNRQSLLDFVHAARYGVHGVVTAAHDGTPLDAVITVAGNNKPVVTDPDFGDYYKLLPTGTYDLTFEAPGYEAVTVTDVQTVWGTPTVLDVALPLIGTRTPSLPQLVTRIDAVVPNPFNPTTEIRFELAAPGPVQLVVMDARGRELRTLVDEERAAGVQAARWDGRDARGASMGSGVYFVVLRTREGQSTAKAVLAQ